MRSSAVLTFCGCVLLSSAAVPAVPSSGLIVPGESIGAVRLGMSHDEVVNAIGPAMGHYARSKRIALSFWGARQPHSDVDGVVLIFFRSGRVVQIQTDFRDYRTREGVNFQTSPETFRRHYGGVREYYSGKQGIIGYYLDARSQGIALRVSGAPFGLGPPPYPGPFELMPNLIVVHPPGAKIILDFSDLEIELSRREAHEDYTTDW